MKWYYAVGKERMGPMEDEEFEACINDGTITEKTLVWNKNLSGWTRLGELEDYPGKEEKQPPIPDLSVDSPSAMMANCTECGKQFPEDELVPFENARVCASCKPLFVQKIREGVAGGGIAYGGFWIRFAAKFIDGIILSVVNMIWGFLLGNMMLASMEDPVVAMRYSLMSMALQTLTAAFYSCFFLGKFAATPGKMICGLEVITVDSDNVSYLRGFGRYFAELISGLILCIGYLMAAWDPEKRALHDRICNTRVIKKNA